MDTFSKVMMVLAAIFIGWMAYRYIKTDKAAFSKENLSKSATTLGILALLLIVFIAFLVMLVRH